MSEVMYLNYYAKKRCLDTFGYSIIGEFSIASVTAEKVDMIKSIRMNSNLPQSAELQTLVFYLFGFTKQCSRSAVYKATHTPKFSKFCYCR